MRVIEEPRPVEAGGDKEEGEAAGEVPATERLIVFATWKATVGESGKPRRLLVDDEALVDLFEQLVGEGEGSDDEEAAGDGEAGDKARRRAAFRFVLALLLVRKRLLILDRAERDRLLVRFKGQEKDAAPTIVEDPGLDEQMLADVESQLDAILAGRD